MQYAASHDIDPAKLLIDWEATEAQILISNDQQYVIPVQPMANTWSVINPYFQVINGSVSSFMPWEAVLRGTNMEYVWSAYYADAYASTYVDQLLAE